MIICHVTFKRHKCHDLPRLYTCYILYSLIKFQYLQRASRSRQKNCPLMYLQWKAFIVCLIKILMAPSGITLWEAFIVCHVKISMAPNDITLWKAFIICLIKISMDPNGITLWKAFTACLIKIPMDPND